jgi:hypothetical protein
LHEYVPGGSWFRSATLPVTDSHKGTVGVLYYSCCGPHRPAVPWRAGPPRAARCRRPRQAQRRSPTEAPP